MQSLVSVKWLLSAFVWTCLLAFFAGISADTLHCDLIDQQCNCFQPHTLRCHLNTSSHLREVLQSFRANTNISKDVKLLDLTVDSLYSLPEDIFKNISIAGLLISNSKSLNNLLPGCFLNSPLANTLEALKLPGNGFQGIPEQLLELRALTSLDLSENSISNIYNNSVIESLITLEELNFAHNGVRQLKELKLPQSLKQLSLKSNLITTDGLQGFNFANLNSIDLSFNVLRGNLTSSVFGSLRRKQPVLTHMDLSHNKIKALGGGVFKIFSNLRKLVLCWNSIELVDLKAFDGLKSLAWVDLSHNDVIELAGGTFRSLLNLTYLDLSFNHLQVVDSNLIQGLKSLEFLNLRSNSIFKVDDWAFRDCKTCKTVVFTDNPLDCTCKLKNFQQWMQTNEIIDQVTKKEAKCSTPPSKSNALLSNLVELSCDEDSEEDEESPMQDFKSDHASDIILQQQSSHGGFINLTWAIRLNKFMCQNLQIYREDVTGTSVEVYSRPISCEQKHYTLHGVDHVETPVEVEKIGLEDVVGLTACLVVINDEDPNEDSRVLHGCGSLSVNQTSLESFLSISLLHASLNWQTEVLSVYFRIHVPHFMIDSCSLLLKVLHTAVDDDVISQQRVSCLAQKFHFQKLPLSANHQEYQVCARIEAASSPDVFSTNCVDVEKDSISSQDSDSFREKTNPILPLILTLVFLILGIIALVVVYFIAKSHSSSWRRSPGRNRQRRRWPFSWPFRRHQRRDGHESVAQADELSLHDNLTVRSLIPEE